MKPASLQKGKRTRGNRRYHALVLVFLFSLVPACAQTPTPTVRTIRFSLVTDTSTAPLMDELVAAYLDGQPNVTIQVEHGANAGRTLEILQADQIDLVSVSWLPESEKAEGSLWYRSYARDPIVIITHPTNPVGGLTLLQLRAVFQGRTLFWEELGGRAMDIIPVSREDGAGTRLSFESLVMAGRDVTLTAVVMPSSRAVVEYVSGTPGAIGYVSTALLAPSVNILAVEGVTPSPTSVEEGRYLLARPFYLAARAEPDAGVAEFVNWIKEGGGHQVIKRGYALAP